MTFTKIYPLTEVENNYDLIMFDLWGVLVEGDSLYPNVGEAINNLMLNKQVLFVSNAPRTRESAGERLRNFGINCRDEQLFTSGQMSRDLIDSKNDKLIYYLSYGNNPNTLADGCLLTSDIEKANILLLTAHLNEEEDLEMFNSLFEQAIKAGVKCVCANPDKIIPNGGKLNYCPGYFAEKFEKMGGEVVMIGKPGKDIFLQAISSVKNPPSLDRVLMIGDTLDMDILGAKNAGIKSGLVLTGNASYAVAGILDEKSKLTAMQEFCQKGEIIPDLLIDITR